MKLTLPALLLLTSAVALPSTALAQEAPAALFGRADINNDGVVSRVEFDSAREALFARGDANGDGRITLSEVRGLRPEGGGDRRQRPNREAMGQLRAIDANNDRAVSLGEFRTAGAGRFTQADGDHNGVLSRSEAAAFARAMGLGG